MRRFRDIFFGMCVLVIGTLLAFFSVWHISIEAFFTFLLVLRRVLMAVAGVILLFAGFWSVKEGLNG